MLIFLCIFIDPICIFIISFCVLSWTVACFLGQEIRGNLSACLWANSSWFLFGGKGLQDLFVESDVCLCVCVSGPVFPAPWRCTILNSLAPLTTSFSMVVTQISAVGGLGGGESIKSSGAPWEMASIHLAFPLCGAAGLSRQSCATRRGGGVG